jgi:hypothetical protein
MNQQSSGLPASDRMYGASWKARAGRCPCGRLPVRLTGSTKYLQPEVCLQLEMEVFRFRQERQFPVPAWLPCPGCSYILSYILMEVDFDRELSLSAEPCP